MNDTRVTCRFYFGDALQNRKILFGKALTHAKYGKVLYVLPEELTELPQLSQDLNEVDRHYLKMIIFLYASNTKSLIEGVATLPDWQNIPSTIILEDLSAYCSNNNVQNAYGITALFIDTAFSCHRTLKTTCRVYIAAKQNTFSEHSCNILKEMFLLISDTDDYKDS